MVLVPFPSFPRIFQGTSVAVATILFLVTIVNAVPLGYTYVMDTLKTSAAFCPRFQKAIEQIGSRWTGVIIRALTNDMHRFGELKSVIPGLSDRMLADRLKELQADGLVTRVVIPETPVRVEYH